MNARQNINDSQFAGITAYAHNGCHGLIIDKASDFFGEHSPIDSVSKIMKLCDDDVTTNSKFIAYSF